MSPVGAASCCLLFTAELYSVSCLGKVLCKLHRGYFIVWESGPGQGDLTALATVAPPAWEVGTGGRDVVRSSCHEQMSEIITSSLKSHRKGKDAQT